MEPIYFRSPAEFRAWLEKNHNTATELLVGFYKKDSGEKGITWPEAVDQALCFGWIDSVRQRVDDRRYSNRFTPRKRTSIWSDVNIKRVAELTEQGQMQPAGLKAFEARNQAKAGSYSNENKDEARKLSDDYEQQFRANKKAWDYYQLQSPSYQRAANWWVMSAKQESTRIKRLATLIADSEKGQRLAQLSYGTNKDKKAT